LIDKTVLVVGASSGVGHATARALGGAGARVAVAARRAAELERLAAELPRGLAVPMDARDRRAVEAGVALVTEKLGAPTIVVYATGLNLKARAIRDLTPADWSNMLDANLSGAFHVTQAVLPALRAAADGLIIYISSTSAKRPDVSGVAYQAAKHGLVGLANGVMEEERANGVRTSVIFPGLIDTRFLDFRPVQTPPDVVARALHAEDVAAACLFVAELPARVHVPQLVMYPSQP
jgi:NADP-dependent 3-hydroxy acid dehydrogenase YdfG